MPKLYNWMMGERGDKMLEILLTHFNFDGIGIVEVSSSIGLLALKEEIMRPSCLILASLFLF